MKKIVCFLSICLFLSLIVFCATDKSPLISVTHPDGWNVKVSEEFHGAKVLEAGYSSCKSCHGNDLVGGEAEISCFGCHITYPHLSGWNLIGVSEFHGQYIREQDWSMQVCQGCHGENYLGGRSQSSCYSCHTDAGGPEACNTCHGSQSNSAPPEDLSDNVSTSLISVGAHQKHVNADSSCVDCHILPTSVSQAGHIDNSPAEVNSSLSWERSKGTCVTACHTDTTKAYIWNNF